MNLERVKLHKVAITKSLIAVALTAAVVDVVLTMKNNYSSFWNLPQAVVETLPLVAVAWFASLGAKRENRAVVISLAYVAAVIVRCVGR